MVAAVGFGSVVAVLVLASFAVSLWAIIDAAVRPRSAFDAAGQNKVLWIVLPIVGIVFLGVLGGILGTVYLAVIRPKVRSAQLY